eukprot:g12320.t1
MSTMLTPLPAGSGEPFPASELVAKGPAVEAKEAAARFDDYKAAGATRVVALVKEDLEKEVEEFRASENNFYKALGGGDVWQPVGILGFLAVMLNPWSTSKLKANIKRNQAKKVPGNMVGEGFIAGGCYVLNKSGDPVFSHLEENFGDHAKPEELWHLWSDRRVPSRPLIRRFDAGSRVVHPLAPMASNGSFVSSDGLSRPGSFRWVPDQ